MLQERTNAYIYHTISAAPCQSRRLEMKDIKPKKVENILARRKKKLGKELLKKGIILS